MKFPTGFALALISVVGCGGGATAPATKAPEPPAPEVRSDVEMIEILAGGEMRRATVPRVVLLEPGDGERAPLRWDLQPWTSELDVTLRSRTSMIGDGAVTDEGDAVEARVSIMLTPGLEGRTAILAVHVLDARLVEATGSYERYADVAAIEGEVYGIHVTSRGQAIGHSVINEAEPSATMVLFTDQIAEALLMPMPEEPVGVGARWRTRAPVELAGIVMIEETVYTLEERDDTRSIVHATVDRLPLTDLQGIVLADQLDSQRTRDAIAALGDLPISHYIRQASPSARGERLAVFTPAALVGLFGRRMTTTATANVEARSGSQQLDVKIADEVELVSPGLDDWDGEPPPSADAAAR